MRFSELKNIILRHYILCHIFMKKFGINVKAFAPQSMFYSSFSSSFVKVPYAV